MQRPDLMNAKKLSSRCFLSSICEGIDRISGADTEGNRCLISGRAGAKGTIRKNRGKFLARSEPHCRKIPRRSNQYPEITPETGGRQQKPRSRDFTGLLREFQQWGC